MREQSIWRFIRIGSKFISAMTSKTYALAALLIMFFAIPVAIGVLMQNTGALLVGTVVGTTANIIGILVFVRGQHRQVEENETDLGIHVKEAVHKKHGDEFIHYVGLDLENRTDRLSRSYLR